MLEIWTDGACEPNPGAGGWGWHDSQGNSQTGGELETTNNRMELMAILMALKALPNQAAATIYSDSQYCVIGMNQWRHGWKRRGWKKKKDEPIKNMDLWMALHEADARVKVIYEWVRGHADNVGNIKADQLANAGRLMTLEKIDEQLDRVALSALYE